MKDLNLQARIVRPDALVVSVVVQAGGRRASHTRQGQQPERHRQGDSAGEYNQTTNNYEFFYTHTKKLYALKQ
jgi:hypothetical protein